MQKKYKKEILNLSLFILGTILISCTFNIFCVPNNFITGGVSGISILFQYLFDINVSYTLMIGNLFLIFTGITVLGFKETIPSIIGSIIYTFAVFLTGNINTILNIHISSTFLNIVAMGVLFGIGYTCVYIAGYTTGGSDILGLIFKKKFNMPLGKSLLIVNSIILLIGTICLGFEMLLIAVIARFIESKVIDSFLLGISDSKVMFINSNKLEEIKDYIIKEIKSGASEIEVKSGYHNENKK